MIESPSTIQADFDQIALLPQDRWNANTHYHHFLLHYVPPCRNALEIGCGTGAFSRLLAERSDHVLALDLSPRMIRIAQERSKQYPNIDFQIADVMTWALPAKHFDCVATIATLHHLPLVEILQKIEKALKVGGTLVVLDLFKAAGWLELLTSGIAWPAYMLLRLVRNGQLRESRAAREAWAQHGRHEHYLTLAEMREVCARILPGAQVRRHLFWRYSIVWKKVVA